MAESAKTIKRFSSRGYTYYFETVDHTRKLKLDPLAPIFATQLCQYLSIPYDPYFNCTEIQLAIALHPDYTPAIPLITKRYDLAVREFEFRFTDMSRDASQIFKYLLAVMHYPSVKEYGWFGGCSYKFLCELIKIPEIRETVFWFARFPWCDAQSVLEKKLLHCSKSGLVFTLDDSGRLGRFLALSPHIALLLLFSEFLFYFYPMSKIASDFYRSFFIDFLEWAELRDVMVLVEGL